MKWNKNWLIKQKDGQFDFDEVLEFPDEIFKKQPRINGLRNIRVTGHGTFQDERLYVQAHIEGVMILPCAISLEDVNYPVDIDMDTVFAFYHPDEDEEVIEVKRDVADLTPVIFTEIMMDVPMRVVKEGASMKQKGNGWQVLNEDALSQEDEIDPRLEKLKDYFNQ